MPSVTDNSDSLTIFSAVTETMWYVMKNPTETITGIPKPPFLIIAPSGAPIKKKIIQATASVHFLCHSTLCLIAILLVAVELIYTDIKILFL